MSTNNNKSKTANPDKKVGRKSIVKKDEHKKVVVPEKDFFDIENELYIKSMKEFREIVFNNTYFTLRLE